MTSHFMGLLNLEHLLSVPVKEIVAQSGLTDLRVTKYYNMFLRIVHDFFFKDGAWFINFLQHLLEIYLIAEVNHDSNQNCHLPIDQQIQQRNNMISKRT